jgi:polysaccharide deacetylase family protein (PEP-CTERM system associated)
MGTSLRAPEAGTLQDPIPFERQADEGAHARPPQGDRLHSRESKSILILNQSFWPDVVATAQQADDLAKFLAEQGDRVSVIASRSLYGKRGARLPSRESVAGVSIYRVSWNIFDKGGTVTRALDYIRFNAACAIKALLLPRQDIVICLTTPPFVCIVGLMLCWLKGTEFVFWTMDLYPDLPVEAGMMRRNGLAHKALSLLDVLCLRRADRVVTLGRCMERRIRAKGVDPRRISIIPPWSDPEEIKDLPPLQIAPAVEALSRMRPEPRPGRVRNAFRTEWNLGDRFVIQYSGNFGLGHDYQTVLDAILATKDDDGIRWVIVGGGVAWPKVERFIEEHEIRNVVLKPYQPRARLGDLISLGDVHLVLMVPSFEGVILPSKFYGIMAAGRPTVFVGPEESEIALTIKEHRCGVVVPNGSAAGLLRVINELRREPGLSLVLGQRGRKTLEERFSRELACRAWYSLLHRPPKEPDAAPPARTTVIDAESQASLDDVRAAPRQPAHVLTFDIEDWFHIIAIPGLEDRQAWGGFPTIAERYTDLILNELAGRGAKGTFFVLGWIANRYPRLIERIAKEGHELASHSYWHRPVYSLSASDFHRDTKDSIKAIEDASGVRVTGYRAPSFSIVQGTEWAFDVMADLGIHWDSSLFPGARAHGGYPCQPGAQIVTAPNGRKIAELPMSALRGLGHSVGFSGGGYLRLLPKWAIELGIQRELRAGRGTVVYLHPRDFAVDCPYVAMPLHRSFRCYWGLHSTLDKFRWLLDHHSFVTCSEALRHEMEVVASLP